MIKVIMFAKRKEGMTREEFRERYESGHVPLVVSELPHMKRYVRNFVLPARGLPEPDFDVVTECWFADVAGWKANTAYVMDPVTGAALAADEDAFIDRAATRFVMVEECATDLEAARSGLAQ